MVHLSLMANPSHLEAVNTAVLGKTRAKQLLSVSLGAEPGARWGWRLGWRALGSHSTRSHHLANTTLSTTPPPTINARTRLPTPTPTTYP